MELLQRLLHTIKGNSGTLGIMRLHRHAAKMEARVKEQDMDNFSQDYEHIQLYFAEFQKNYRKILHI